MCVCVCVCVCVCTLRFDNFSYRLVQVLAQLEQTLAAERAAKGRELQEGVPPQQPNGGISAASSCVIKPPLMQMFSSSPPNPCDSSFTSHQSAQRDLGAQQNMETEPEAELELQPEQGESNPLEAFAARGEVPLQRAEEIDAAALKVAYKDAKRKAEAHPSDTSLQAKYKEAKRRYKTASSMQAHVSPTAIVEEFTQVSTA